MTHRATANLANFVDPDEDEVTEELKNRFHRQIYFVEFGDGVIAINPQCGRDLPENSPQNGRRYCSKKPQPNLSPHVYSLAHAVYRDVISEGLSHSVLISGVSGSGKTEVFEMFLSQMFRECGATRGDDVAFLLMKSFSVMKRITTYRSRNGPNSSAANLAMTLYFDESGVLRTAKISTYLLKSRLASLQANERGHLNIYYDLVAALLNGGLGLSVSDKVGRVLQILDPSFIQLNSQMERQHSEEWHLLTETVRLLGFGEQVPSGDRFNVSNTFLDSLLGMLLLAALKFDVYSPSGEAGIMNLDALDTASQLLGVSGQLLLKAMLTEARKLGNPSPENFARVQDQIVHELYNRIVHWLEEHINKALPSIHEDYMPVHIADLSTFDEWTSSDSTLENLCHNMAAEFIQAFINKAVFAREKEACDREGLKVAATKKHVCEELVDMAFGGVDGLLPQLSVMCLNSSLSDLALVKSLNKQFKTHKHLYVSSKELNPATFVIQHSHRQVSYQVSPSFREEDLIISNREIQTLLAHSENGIIHDIFQSALTEFSNTDAHLKLQYSYITYTRLQLSGLINQLNGTVPHLISCVKPSTIGPYFDEAFVRPQIRAACLPDIIHQKRFGFSHWMTIADFLKRYRMLGLPMSTHLPCTPEVCKIVLDKTGIAGKGPDVTKHCVFLIYWHKEKLDTLVDEFKWKVTLVQACVRGHLTRKRLHSMIAARLRSRDQVFTYHRRNSDIYRRQSSDRYQNLEAVDDLYETIIDTALDKLDELPHSTWAKVIYMEEGTEVAKVYADELSLMVTGSSLPFDGTELGLNFFDYYDRLEETRFIVSSLEKGIELHRDSDGNLLAKRLCKLPVTVRWRAKELVLSADMLRTRGELPLGHLVKIFDMKEFRCLLSLEMRNETLSRSRLSKMCITALSLGSNDLPLMSSPCWLAVLNIQALHLLSSDKELESLSLLTSQMSLSKDEDEDEMKLKQQGAKQRRQRKLWSKSDQRPQLKMKEASSRKIREELRKRGEKVSDHMRYSWEEEPVGQPSINMDQLYERIKKEATGVTSPNSSSPEPGKQWAKVDVALRQVSRELHKAE